MKREHEAEMFAAATLRALNNRTYGFPEYVESYYDQLVDGQDVTVLSPKGSKFKNCACIVVTSLTNNRTRTLLNEYNPDSMLSILGYLVFVFKEGQHVMAATGAAAALRKQAEG